MWPSSLVGGCLSLAQCDPRGSERCLMARPHPPPPSCLCFTLKSPKVGTWPSTPAPARCRRWNQFTHELRAASPRPSQSHASASKHMKDPQIALRSPEKKLKTQPFWQAENSQGREIRGRDTRAAADSGALCSLQTGIKFQWVGGAGTY